MKNNTPNIRVQYREALERLRAAEDEAAVVKARYDKVLADVIAKQKTIEQEVEQLEDALDRAIEIADQTPTAAPKPKQAATTASPPPSSSDGDGQPDAPPYLREGLEPNAQARSGLGRPSAEPSATALRTKTNRRRPPGCNVERTASQEVALPPVSSRERLHTGPAKCLKCTTPARVRQ